MLKPVFFFVENITEVLPERVGSSQALSPGAYFMRRFVSGGGGAITGTSPLLSLCLTALVS